MKKLKTWIVYTLCSPACLWLALVASVCGLQIRVECTDLETIELP